MNADTYIRLLAHRGHSVALTTYGGSDENITLECDDCAEVIITQDLEGDLLAEVDTLLGSGTY